VAELSIADGREEPRDRDHSLQNVDVSGWSDADWVAVRLLLTSANITAERVGTSLVFPSARAGEVEELVSSVVGGSGLEVDAQPRPRARTADIYGAQVLGTRVVAGGLRRLGGWVIDGVVGLVMVGPLRVVFGGDPLVAAAGAVLVGLYEVLGVWLFGQTAGKALVRTRVLDIATGERPAWPSAVIRWAVPAAVGLISYLGTWGLVLGPIGQVVVYGGVLLPPNRRGLHDLAARTVVVLAD
jgi:uncharacterized RDD family membrane protein YckC